MSERRTVIVTCSMAAGSLQRVRVALEAVGFQVEEVLEFAGSILGSWDQRLEILEGIEEVDAVQLSDEAYAVGTDDNRPADRSAWEE